ncbi:MAG: phosphoribosylglycinamide formyltransferase [Candidatus Omnitrophica bacterium]|nr:phosphoribosylglycinamide formyltransferase [Candidatus Omnitrophota bacterium]
MKNLAILCSGFGSNLQAIINSVKKGKIKANIALVLSDKVDSYALVRAKKAGLLFVFADPNSFLDRESYDQYLVKKLKKIKIDYVVLAGFMRIVSPYFIKKFKNKIVNIHPSLLPAFKGTQGIVDALNYGVKVTGVSVHFVNEQLDGGPIILQESIKIQADDTAETLAARIHKLEHKLYPQALKLLIDNKLTVKSGKVLVEREK